MGAVMVLQQVARDNIPGQFDKRLIQLARSSGGLPCREIHMAGAFGYSVWVAVDGD